MYPQLTEYIKSSKAQGLSDEQIKTNLLSAGWTLQDIQGAMGVGQISVPSVASAMNRPLSSPVNIQPKSTSSFAKVLAILIIFAVIAGGGYYVYANYFKQKQNMTPPVAVNNETTAVPVTTPTQTTIPIPDPTINWKTYSNAQFGFQFQYSSDFDPLTVFNNGNGLTGITFESASPTTSTNISNRPGLSLNVIEKTGNI